MRISRGRRRKQFAKGKKAVAICDRTGFKHKRSEMVIEPGTNLLVHRSWSDGKWNRVDHPQNFPADVSESVGIQNPRLDTPME
jgi:hypothetical protein